MTAPLSLLPRCVVYVDGVRFADGQPTEADDEPVALTDLQVVWGRNNTLDQPAPATCTFQVLDLPGGTRFGDVLHIGARISVRADATIYPDPTVSTIPTLIPGPILNGTATGSGTASNTLLAVGPTGPALLVTYPPRAYSLDPSAWDAVPRSLAGQAWRLKLAATFPPALLGWRNYAAELRGVAFTSPAGPGVALPDAQVLAAPAVGDAAFDLTFVPPAGVWLGLQLRIYPVGPAWVDLGPGSWSSLDARSWDSLGTFVVSGLQMLAPATGALRSGEVFDGRVTDMTARYSLDVGGTLVDVIAQDLTAELGNRYVGAAPYPLEDIRTRFSRIVTDSGQLIKSTVDAGVAAVQVSYQDIDSQPATALLQMLARSVAGVLWSATSLSSGPFLRLEDVNARPALLKLVMVPPKLQNLFTQPSFEGNSSSAFGATNGTLSTPTVAGAPAGSRVLQVTATAAGAVNAFLQTAARPPVTVGKLYRATVYVRTAVAGGAATFRVDGAYRDTGGASIGSGYNSGAQPLNSTTWRRVTLNFPAAPAGAVALSIALNVNAGASAGQVFQYDAIQITEITATTDPDVDYFDGDTPDTSTETYAWDGAQWASTSTRLGAYTVGTVPVAPIGGIELDACSVLLEPVRWQQNSDDDGTRVVVTWKEQLANPSPPPAVTPTDHDETATDVGAEIRTGRRRVGVSTVLALQADAIVTANSYLSRLNSPGWRVSGLTIDLSVETIDPDELDRVMRILDGATRLGLPILLTNLPDWAPTGRQTNQGLYLEGGRFTNTNGYWRIELLVSSATGQGKSVVRWVDLPAALPWDGFGELTWNDLTGVGL